MSKKRVHEIAKAQGVTSKELLAALKSAGVEAKAAAASLRHPAPFLRAMSSHTRRWSAKPVPRGYG